MPDHGQGAPGSCSALEAHSSAVPWCPVLKPSPHKPAAADSAVRSRTLADVAAGTDYRVATARLSEPGSQTFSVAQMWLLLSPGPMLQSPGQPRYSDDPSGPAGSPGSRALWGLHTRLGLRLPGPVGIRESSSKAPSSPPSWAHFSDAFQGGLGFLSCIFQRCEWKALSSGPSWEMQSG